MGFHELSRASLKQLIKFSCSRGYRGTSLAKRIKYRYCSKNTCSSILLTSYVISHKYIFQVPERGYTLKNIFERIVYFYIDILPQLELSFGYGPDSPVFA